MKAEIFYTLANLAAAWGSPWATVQARAASTDGLWQAPGLDDVRGPCPMLNTLANHGYLPRSGRNFTLDNIINGLSAGVNFAANFSSFLHDFALTTNPEPNATTWSLGTLRTHNILEHDASLSRLDAHFGNNWVFDQKTFDQTKSYYGRHLTIQQAADARLARVLQSNATNPDFILSDLGVGFGFGESAAFFLVFGDIAGGTANTAWITYLFENERLPTRIGWSRPETPVHISDLTNVSERIENATSASPYASAMKLFKRRSDPHAGYYI